ncbi:hypothetical protein HYW21_07495 [Candidatus Woesearchaeota archaeon]|nr:hypothetical protein [Candidatus Woesearchaeota archaeon]
MKRPVLYASLMSIGTVLFSYDKAKPEVYASDNAMLHSLSIARHPTERYLGRITFVDQNAEAIFPFSHAINAAYLDVLLNPFNDDGPDNPIHDLERLADLASNRVLMGYELFPLYADVVYPLPREAVMLRRNAFGLLTTRAQTALAYLSFQGLIDPEAASEYSRLLDNLIHEANVAEQDIDHVLDTETPPGDLSCDDWHVYLMVRTAYVFENLLAQQVRILNEVRSSIEPCSGVESQEKDYQANPPKIHSELPIT